MGVLIVKEDFTGRYAIPQTVYSELDSFINDREEPYLIELLGASFYEAFKNDLANKVPQTQKFLKIFNAFRIDYNFEIVESKGMKDMLKGFVFFEYMRNTAYKGTTQGMVINSADTSVNVSPANLFAFYNDSVASYKSIQMYIKWIKPEDYTDVDFNGSKKNVSIQFF